ncbi:MAG: carbohydrate-binding family 9-like protein [Treponema sp.]|nr:carbohydrate-binding family 9-like protein [Treponema sp.]
MKVLDRAPCRRVDETDKQTMGHYRIPEPRVTEFAPPVYHCRRASESLKLDGNLNKPFWKDAPWTADFRDIEGADKSTPHFRTRAKLLWDDTALYIGAELQGNEIWGTISKRDDIIFRDNDFEIFIDPDGDTHVYCEFEMNALNTLWDLLMVKPYRDGGKFINSFDIKGLETAVLIDGELNNPSVKNRAWSLEVKMPFESLSECYKPGTIPQAGDYWRMNFSRVHWLVDIVNNTYQKRINPQTGKPFAEYNWVWSPTGLINIHYPELWGFVFFCDAAERYAVPADEFLKWRLRCVYYQLHAAFDETGRFSLADTPEGISVQITDYDFTLSCPASDGKSRLVMRTDGWVGRI